MERRSHSLDAGITRLESVATGLLAQPLAVVADRVVADMTTDSPTEDDVVVACLRYLPGVASAAPDGLEAIS